MDTFLQSLTYWHWFGFGVLLAILDVVSGANFVLLWSGLAAFTVGVLMVFMPKMAWEWQFAIFGVGVFMSLAFWRYHLKKQPAETDRPNLNRRANQYLDREFYLEEPIVNGRGKVRIDDTHWRVEGDDMPEGTKIKVIDVNGVVLKVEKV